MTDITELAQLRGRTVDYPYYLVECDCGKIYPSSELSGGEPMGDSGDYSDCYCPHCGEGEEHFAECADPETAWKAQQDKIDALVEALEGRNALVALQKIEIRELNAELEKAQRANAAQDDHINQQQDRIESLEKKNAELGKYAGGLESFRTAYMEWGDKTDWVRTDRRFDVVKPLGKHLADVLRAYIEHLESRTVAVKQGEVLVTVVGFTGCGKSAIAGEIEIAMKAIGVPVTWANGDSEKRMTGADWLTAIEMYKPTVRIVEVNIPRPAGIKVEAE
ncbi:ead/Ea22-like family protein [Klebsiella pneumoniae]|uniref:ead/Ea22-like family protein n=1 Tax=Klebsiella pneumoniae TaxID=573 RepID=UPI002AAAFB28|nr:ead/Ea22-like family protein [Klebsiella pneumoniae]WPU88482.1 ead/Ea22-like family protein [Klebsiella pneumoniae]